MPEAKFQKIGGAQGNPVGPVTTMKPAQEPKEPPASPDLPAMSPAAPTTAREPRKRRTRKNVKAAETPATPRAAPRYLAMMIKTVARKRPGEEDQPDELVSVFVQYAEASTRSEIDKAVKELLASESCRVAIVRLLSTQESVVETRTVTREAP